MNNKGFSDPRRAYSQAPAAGKKRAVDRFAPADNLYDAIRGDVAPVGGIDLHRFERDVSSEPPFSDIDWDPNDDE